MRPEQLGGDLERDEKKAQGEGEGIQREGKEKGMSSISPVAGGGRLALSGSVLQNG